MATKIDAKTAWAVASYGRFDRLNVPAFSDSNSAKHVKVAVQRREAHLIPIDMDIPNELMTIKEICRGETVTSDLPDGKKLALLMRYCASPLRFETSNVYSLHRAVPSARCLYPARVLVLTNTAGMTRAYECQPDFHAMELLEEYPHSDALPAGVLGAILVVSQFWVTAEKYGEFAPFPCTLEAGMLQGQLGLMLRLLNWRSDVTLDRDDYTDYCNSNLDCTLFVMPVEADLESIIHLQPSNPEWIVDRCETSGLAERYDNLTDIVAVMNACSESLLPVAESAPNKVPDSLPDKLAQRDILDVMRSRNSGNDLLGMNARFQKQSAKTRQHFNALTRALKAQRLHCQADAFLETSLIWLNATGGKVGLYDEMDTWVETRISSEQLLVSI